MNIDNGPPDVALKDSNGKSKPPLKRKVTIARLLGSEKEKYALYLDCVPGTTSFEIAGVGETENTYPTKGEITRMVLDFEAAETMSRMNDNDSDVEHEKENMDTSLTQERITQHNSLSTRNSSKRLARMLELTQMSLRKKKKKGPKAFVQPKIRRPTLANK